MKLGTNIECMAIPVTSLFEASSFQSRDKEAQTSPRYFSEKYSSPCGASIIADSGRIGASSQVETQLNIWT